MQLHLTALKSQAAALGPTSLAEQLETTNATMRGLMGDVAEAAVTTTSKP
jgi:hypothetical protein